MAGRESRSQDGLFREERYLAACGLAPRHVERVSDAIKENTAWLILYVLLVMTVMYFSMYVLLDPAVRARLPLGAFPGDPVVSVVDLAGLAVAVGVLLSAWRFGPRRRLLASAFRCTEILLELGTGPAGGRETESVERVLMPRRLAVRRRRRVARVAWAITRDTARCAGRPATAGETVGELLLWFAENPADRRRRPIVAVHLVELIAAVADNLPVPHAQFAPAAKYRTKSPRAALLMQLRVFVRSAVVSGAVLAVLTAILRIWLG
ncbi:hypothetical protein AB0L41_02225 [Amycolatopsis mediterranei]|uniref:hypothetical protein n=1 Tax=Amycolatopsis mediterranei TaxID=33910 RepID=UPI003412E349